MLELIKVMKSAKNHKLQTMASEVYICKNDNGYYYCDGESIRRFNLKDTENQLNPKILGYFGNVTFLGLQKTLEIKFFRMV